MGFVEDRFARRQREAKEQVEEAARPRTYFERLLAKKKPVPSAQAEGDAVGSITQGMSEIFSRTCNERTPGWDQSVETKSRLNGGTGAKRPIFGLVVNGSRN